MCQYSNGMASNKNHKQHRRYELRERALRRERTRLRITEAAVALHGTVGPANTTISDVARLAGVQRMTVYNHFATDADLFDACSTHWITRNLPPDADAWGPIEDPRERIGAALREMYVYYSRNRKMLGNVLRDAPLIPALGSIMSQKWWPVIEHMVDVLAGGIRTGEKADDYQRATLRLVLDFHTWRTLTGSGLDDEESARLAARLAARLVAETPAEG